MKKFFVLALALVLVLSTGAQVFASSSDSDNSASLYDAPTPFNNGPSKRLLNVTEEELNAAKADGLEIIEKITDPAVIQQMVNAGEIETKNGKLPTSVTTYFARDKESDLFELNQNNALSKAGISVTKTNYYDGQYFDDYDRYEVDGPANFSTTYSKTGTRSWNTSITGSVKVGADLYSVAEVEASVSTSVGYSFNVSETKSQTYTVNIPAKKYWEIKVWVSYLVYEYTAKVGSVTIATGKTWRPNGLIIKKTEYSK